MELKDVQKKYLKNVISIRINDQDKKFIINNEINPSKIFRKALKELQKK